MIGWSVPFLIGFGMGSEPATNMFLPFPAYLICSLRWSESKSSVGSRRGSVTCTSFPEAVRRMFGLDGPDDAVCDTAAVGSEGQNVCTSSSNASPPSTARMMSCFRFSAPSFTYTPERR